MRLTALFRRETGGRATNAALVAASREDRTLAQRARASSRVAEIEGRRRSKEASSVINDERGERGPSAISNDDIATNDVDRRTAAAKPRDRRWKPSALSRGQDGITVRGKASRIAEAVAFHEATGKTISALCRHGGRSDKDVRGSVRSIFLGKTTPLQDASPPAEAVEAS